MTVRTNTSQPRSSHQGSIPSRDTSAPTSSSEDGIELILDSETTGVSRKDDRICEIGIVEVRDLLPTGRTFHVYIDPKKPMPADAQAVHGLSDDFLRGKPVFRQVVGQFLEFIGDRPLVAHNASFDISFINAELARIGRDPLPNPVVDTLALARKVRPGSPASLDALVKAYKVDASKRHKHGALIDAEILAGVYLNLRGGAQKDLTLTGGSVSDPTAQVPLRQENISIKKKRRITREEFDRHKAFVRAMGPDAIWMSHEIYARHLRTNGD